ncbi:MAG: GNAT family N-acetyltransferase [Actinomycetota bacterium]|nr:GNAT family N-acetyltransferase [Actinomycetota bacterium]
MTQLQPARVHRLDADGMRDHLREALEIYGAAMGYPASVVDARYGHAAAHTTRLGFQAVAAFDTEEALTGFGYGYTARPGQWWYDQVADALGRGRSRQWLRDSFELCEFHVRPDQQGMGIGRLLLDTLLDAVSLPRVVLSTPDSDTRAFRLYRSEGFVDLLRGHYFPGDARPFAVLGRELATPGR